MIYEPQKYKIELPNVNEEMLKLVGELDDKEARITLARFLRANIGFTVELLSGIKLAPFQEITLKGLMTRNFSLCVFGRGCGKCESYHDLTYVLEKSRGLILLKDLYPALDFSRGEKWIEVPTTQLWNGNDWQLVNKVLLQPKINTIGIKTSRGYELIGSENHLIKVIDTKTCQIVWKRYHELTKNDYACISRTKTTWGGFVNNEESYLIGLLIGDGCYSNTIKHIKFTSADEQLLSFVEKFPCGKRMKSASKAYDINLETSFAQSLLARYGISRGLSYTKEIPQSIFQDHNALKSCVQGLFDTDGTVDKARLVVGFCTTSEKLAKQIQNALLLFGIISTLSKKKTNSSFGKAYMLQISGQDVAVFNENIGFRLDRKRVLLQKHLATAKFNTNVNVVPGAKEKCESIKETLPLSRSQKKIWHDEIQKRDQKSISYETLSKTVRFLRECGAKEELAGLEEILSERFYFDRITEITQDKKDCIDFNIPVGERYWSNGFISHNTFIAAIFCFIECIFNPGSKIIIAGPTFRTARNIFAELEKIVKSPMARFLSQALIGNGHLSKRADMFEWHIGTSSIKAIPLSGDRVRGLRASTLIIDEFLLISKDLVNNVLKPFLTSPADIAERIKIEEIEDGMVKRGEITDEQRTTFKNNTKMIALSSASYTFENLYDTYVEWREQIYNEKTDANAKYFIAQLSYRALPEHMMDRTIIDEAANGGSSHASFQREYEAQFTDGSDSYYSMRKMKECTVEDGKCPHVMLRAPEGMKCILAIDPNGSNSPTADYFAMDVLWMDMESKVNYSIHNYANAGGDLKDHQAYLLYVLQNFDIEMIILDNAGGRTFIDSCNESELFIKVGIKLGYIEYNSDLEGEDAQKFDEMIQKARNEYNKGSRRICVEQVFTSKFLRVANEHLQAAIDFKKIGFASPLTLHDNYETISEDFANKLDMVKSLTGNETIYDFISTQDDLINQIKKQCALIEVSTTSLGTQSFDLPQHLKRNKSATRARKDNYTALLLANWGAKIYNDMMFRPKKDVHATFKPMMFGKRV